MTSPTQSDPQQVEAMTQPVVETPNEPVKPSSPSPTSRRDRMWWAFRFVSQPLLFFVAGAALLGLLGVAQRMGWISTASSGGTGSAATAAADVDYICPMMCTPPQQEPGRCPVCAMELVPASTGGGGGDERSIVVDAASRRVANIRTVSVRSIPMMRTINAVGELQYDESSLKTISAYSDGRFDELYVDFTGAIVREGDRLASFYSPELYSAQVEYIQAGTTVRSQSSTSLASVANANRRLLTNSRQRLIELGMSTAQLETLDRTQQAQSRMDIVAPMSGTVIDKLAVEGEYVKAGQPAFRLANLSTVWLMLELFPKDVAAIRCGQSVEATMKSLPGRTCRGQVAFIDPDVDPKSRTVGVRVVIPNDDGMLRVGDYAKARITAPLEIDHDAHVASQPVEDSLAVEQFDAPPTPLVTVIPRRAVLSAANESVVYVATEPGRFEIRRIVTGPTSGNDIVVLKGLVEGDSVAIAGNFLLDSQMQLAGNPSLIDPTRAAPPMKMIPGFDATMLAAIHRLPVEDQTLALKQVICPVTDFKLGSMGVPPKVMVDGKPVFLCCEGCRESLLDNPQVHLQRLREYAASGGEAESNVADAEMPFPPIGTIEPMFTEDNFPGIGTIEPINAGEAADAVRSAEAVEGPGGIER